MHPLQIGRTTEAKKRITRINQISQKNDCVAGIAKPLPGDMLRVINNADHRNRRSWIDRAIGALVVKAYVPSGDRRVKRATSVSKTSHCLAKLPKYLRVMRI